MKFLPGAMGVPIRQVKGPCAMGVDVKPTKWSVAIAEPVRVADETVPKLCFYGNAFDPETVLELIKAYRVISVVGDSRPDATVMSRLQIQAEKELRIDFWRSQYNTAPSNVEMTVNSKERLLTLERTMTMDGVFYSFSTGLGIAIPQNYREICRDDPSLPYGGFVKELLASTRVPVLWHGEQWSRWTEVTTDDSMHALNFLLIAFRLGKLHLASSGQALLPEKGIVMGTLSENMDGDDDDEGDLQPLWGEDGRARVGSVTSWEA